MGHGTMSGRGTAKRRDTGRGMLKVINTDFTFCFGEGLTRKHSMKTIMTHRDMDLWKVSMDFVVDLNRITGTFPDHEKFGLVSQLRRAGVSICSNIAEGAAENHPRELLNLYPFLESVYEIDTQLEIAFRLGYIKSINQEKEILNCIRRMLVSLLRTIRKSS
jgi:four helix bundle protein